MADLGVGKRDDRQLENQNDAGDSTMHDEGTLCTAPPGPLPDLNGGKTIMSDGDGGSASVGGGSLLAHRAAVGYHPSDPDQGEGSSGGSDLSRGRDQNRAPTGHAHAVTSPQTVATPRRNYFTLGPCAKPQKAELESSKLQKSFLLSNLSAQAAKGNTVRWLPSGRGDAIRRLAAVLC